MQFPLRTVLIIAIATLSCAGFSNAAPPTAASLYPSGMSRGQTITVTVNGSFSNWPASVWVDRKGLTIEPEKDKGKLKVTADKNAAGTYLLRLYDKEGATQLRPFIVGSLPEVVEREPNNDPGKAQAVARSVVVNGKLEKSGDVDGYLLDLTKGQTLVASVNANWGLGSPMDPVMQICTPDGFVLKQNDESRGMDPQIVFQPKQDGTYVVRLFAFPATPNSTIGFYGNGDCVYRLTMTTGAFVDHTTPFSLASSGKTSVRAQGWNIPADQQRLEIERSSPPLLHGECANAIDLPTVQYANLFAEETKENQPLSVTTPVVITGRIDEPGDEDTFRFTAAKGKKLTCRIEANSLGFPTDPALRITDSDGKQISAADDTSRQRDCSLVFSPPKDGEYQLHVLNGYRAGGFRHVYRLTIEEAVPDFTLTLAADSFVIPKDKPLEIPVTINRQNGFAEEIELTVKGLPEGVAAEPAKSLPKGDTAKTVKLKLTASQASPGGPIEIAGKAGQQERIATFSVVKSKRTEAWLTASGK